jgi:hypothetical protein
VPVRGSGPGDPRIPAARLRAGASEQFGGGGPELRAKHHYAYAGARVAERRCQVAEGGRHEGASAGLTLNGSIHRQGLYTCGTLQLKSTRLYHLLDSSQASGGILGQHAFPNPYDTPPSGAQSRSNNTITPPVCFNFVYPILNVAFRSSITIWAPVPEASVDKQSCPLLQPAKIWSAW